MDVLKILDEIEYRGSDQPGSLDDEINRHCDDCFKKMCDDFNTAQTMASLFEIASRINSIFHGQLDKQHLSDVVYQRMVSTFRSFVSEVLGLEPQTKEDDSQTDQLIELLIAIRTRARVRKDFETADKIRDDLANMGIQLKDEKSGKTTFKIKP